MNRNDPKYGRVRAEQIEMFTEELGLETVMICEMEKGGKGSTMCRPTECKRGDSILWKVGRKNERAVN